MLNQLNKFSSHLGEQTKPIRDLLSNVLGSKPRESIPKIKRIIMYKEILGIIWTK